MTTPGQPGPDGAWQYGSGFGQDLDEAEVRARLTGQSQTGIDDSILGWGKASDELSELAQDVVDGQLSLNEALALLAGVEGYGTLWTSKNWPVTGGRRIALPFDSWYGPHTPNVTMYGRGLRLHGFGLWTVFAHVTFAPPQSSWLGPGVIYAKVWITVRRNGASTPWTELQFDLTISSIGPETASFAKSVVIPDDGALYTIEIEVQHPNTGARVYGGTQRTRLSVHRWSTGTDNAANVPTVGDGGTLS